MSVLRGPADADHFRVKVGRYGDRWYVDPLPSCPIAEASDWQGPSWSIVKGAAGKDWSYVTNKRNGHTPTAELQRIAQLEEPDARTAAYNTINKAGLSQAGGRGTIVHLWAEDLLAGRGPRLITDPVRFAHGLSKASLDEATEYVEALAAFFDHYQPEVIAAEYVAIHRDLNGHGYGCTPDVIARIQGQTVGIDWKTRGVDSDHGAYPEEAAQIAAGAMAQYMIVAGPDGHPMRRLIPTVDAGIVVSIRPDGCRVYPVDLEPAWEHVQAMHAFWVARLTEKAAIGKPWPPAPVRTERPAVVSMLETFTAVTESDNQQEDLWTTSNTPSHTSIGSSASSTAPSTGSTTPRSICSSHPNNSSKPSPNSATAPPDDLTYTAHLLATAMADWPPKTIAYMREWWPAGCPTPTKVRTGQATWTDQQLTAIEQLCDLADAPFWQTTPPPASRYTGSSRSAAL